MTETRRATLRGLLQQPTDDGDALTFTASSTALNRYGYALRHDGWRINNYNANPVVLWLHMDFMPPIGRGRASLRSEQLLNAVTFDRSDPFAVTVERKYRDGFLNAVSVGFNFVDGNGKPLGNWWRMSPDDIKTKAHYDLSEVSAVPVPADPRALRKHRAQLAAGIMDDLYGEDIEDLSEELDAILLNGEPRDPSKLIIPPTAPVLPGNGDTEQRVALLEDTLSKLRATMTALPPHNTAVEDSDWDGSAAVSGMAEDRDELRYCHAWVDPDGDPNAKSSYKLPHHRSQGGPANLAACRAILSGRGAQADIPEAELEAARRHAQRHLDAAENADAFTPDAVQSLLAAATITL